MVDEEVEEEKVTNKRLKTGHASRADEHPPSLVCYSLDDSTDQYIDELESMIDLEENSMPVMWPGGLNMQRARQAIKDLEWAQQVNNDIEADQRKEAAIASLIAADSANAIYTDSMQASEGIMDDDAEDEVSGASSNPHPYRYEDGPGGAPPQRLPGPSTMAEAAASI